jgi:hypothetical protein
MTGVFSTRHFYRMTALITIMAEIEMLKSWRLYDTILNGGARYKIGQIVGNTVLTDEIADGLVDSGCAKRV